MVSILGMAGLRVGLDEMDEVGLRSQRGLLVLVEQEVEHLAQLRRPKAQIAPGFDRAGEMALDLAQVLLADELFVAAGDKAAFALDGLDEALAFQVREARLVVMALTRRLFASARIDGSCSPSASWPAMICALIWLVICS